MNKIGKRMKFRRKKKEKTKTENRARKALKTISLILGEESRNLDILEIIMDFLYKSVWHRSLTQLFKPFRFWCRICGDIHNSLSRIYMYSMELPKNLYLTLFSSR
jgi:hypothetical protein